MTNQYKLIVLCILSTLSTGVFSIESDELRSGLSNQQSVAVTIYNHNLALVKDLRKVKLASGVSNLALRDVSAQIRPETALLRSLSNPGSFTTLEQNFDFDLLTPQKLLEKYVGKNVNIVRVNPATGAESSEPATVLSANNGVVMKIGNRIETGMPGRIVYDDVPANLRDRPTLVTKINNKTATEQTVELSYLTGGLGWKADYVAELSPKEDSIDLSGWVTLTNTSGTSYNNAKLQLVAGDVNRVQSETPRTLGMMRKSADMVMESSAPMAEESLLEYHLYSLDRPTTIAENQTKQVALLSANNVPARKELVLRGADYYYGASYGDLGQKLKVGVFVEFDNKEAAKLGMPLPKGVMRMYKKDSQDNAQFIGEDNIDHTPKNETVRLKLGESFDVTANKKQTDFKTMPRPTKGNSMYESAYEIILKNAKKERTTVTVQEPIPADWKILKESHPSQKATSNTAVWKVEIPAEGKTTLTYRVQVKY
ncbi:MAG: DUF4139 domain-containing protein [Methylotenera sp.]|nr:DUF4139 domain-containing protein [Methylotenera sp.]MDO9232301.1 DUF4139 domain-containing protein [Methylotenera sp.]MDO9388125.1 DUF4139 domain-containing protein [Methylotenera sp.]MDP2102170.1 DUF4139 domain-containing protein [Methylotenera sp.]MDP2281130.1 DUF4139 domain-containing protein [Methylotenera sp.]